MALNKSKLCPGCKINFHCNSAAMLNCECNTIKLSSAAVRFLKSKYKDCLCIKCLTNIQQKYACIKAFEPGAVFLISLIYKNLQQDLFL